MGTGVETIKEALEDAAQVIVKIKQADLTTLTDKLEEVRSEVETLNSQGLTASSPDSVSSTNTDSDGSVETQLELGGRSFVEVYYNTGGSGTVFIETSNDATSGSWRELDQLDTAQSGTEAESNEQFPWVSRQYIRARIVNGAADVEVDIAAS